MQFFVVLIDFTLKQTFTLLLKPSLNSFLSQKQLLVGRDNDFSRQKEKRHAKNKTFAFHFILKKSSK